MATKKDERQLTNYQIVSVARAISSANMEAVALNNLDIDETSITHLKKTHWEDSETFIKEIIRAWAHKNEGPGQVQVSIFG